MPLGKEVDLSLGHVALDGYPVPPSRKGTAAPLFLAPVYCGQTVAHLSYCGVLVPGEPGSISSTVCPSHPPFLEGNISRV